MHKIEGILPTWSESTIDLVPITTTFFASPRREWLASSYLQRALSTDLNASISALRISLQASQTPNWYAALVPDTREFIRCELRVGCALARNYTSLLLPTPTPTPVTSGPWAEGASGLAFEPFGRLRGLQLLVPWMILVGAYVGVAFLKDFTTYLWRCTKLRNEHHLSAINPDSPAYLVLSWILIGGSGGLLQALGPEETPIKISFFTGVLVSSFGIAAIASSYNDVFLDKCWKRVTIQALRKRNGVYHRDSLRAASIDWIDTTHRVFTLHVSARELQAAGTYILLRWCFVISIAVIQRSIDIQGPFFAVNNALGWRDDNTAVWRTGSVSVTLSATRRPIWIGMAVLAHACCIFLGLAISGIPPWSLFYADDLDSHLLEAYKPYLEEVREGSIASSNQVADYLAHKVSRPLNGPPPSLKVHHKPGMQVWIKLRGTCFGLVLSLVGPLLLLPVTISYRTSLESLDCVESVIGDQYHHCNRSGPTGTNMTRYVCVLCYSVTGLGYTLIRNFATWTCTLESLTLSIDDRVKELWTTVRNPSSGFSRQELVPPFHGLNHLGATSGMSLAARQHTRLSNTQAGWLFLLFGLQNATIRVLLVYAISGLAKVKHMDTGFTVAMALWPMAFIWPIIYVPIVIWLIVPFQAPLGPQDGWRWAKVACDVLDGEGTYGVVDGKARVAVNATKFEEEDLF